MSFICAYFGLKSIHSRKEHLPLINNWRVIKGLMVNLHLFQFVHGVNNFEFQFNIQKADEAVCDLY